MSMPESSAVAEKRFLFRDPHEIVQLTCPKFVFGSFSTRKKKKSSPYGPHLLATFHMSADVRMLNTSSESRNGLKLLPEGPLQHLLHLQQKLPH